MSWRLVTSYADYLYQLHQLMRDPLYRGRGVPPGNGESILLIPGFLAGDWSLGVLGRWLNRIGYQVYYSGIDWNINCPQKTSTLLRWRLEQVGAEAQQPVTIIGHSLGGVLARFLGASVPHQVRQIITLGSPIDGAMRIHPLVPLAFQMIQHVQGFAQPLLPPCAKDIRCTCDFIKGAFAALPPEVRFTAIYSKQDEIVDWQACIDSAKVSYEVQGQHLGLIVNLAVYRLLGQLLGSHAPAELDPPQQERHLEAPVNLFPLLTKERLPKRSPDAHLSSQATREAIPYSSVTKGYERRGEESKLSQHGERGHCLFSATDGIPGRSPRSRCTTISV